ncbi:MAG: hypothetical protein JWQ42_4667 [Edaphobacter sp.]|nr:hypothetical protein [Edaphobacter sp.]
MTSWFAQFNVFSAHATVCLGEDNDLPKGTHLRAFPSAEIGFPLAPMGVWRMPALRMQPLDFFWADRQGRAQATPNLDTAGGELIGTLKAITPDTQLIGVEVRFSGGPAASGQVILIDRVGQRVISRRSQNRWVVGAPDITGLRLRGRGIATIIGWVIPADLAFEHVVASAPITTLSAPIRGDSPWYVGGEGPERAMDRVRGGAPLRFTPPDRPDGPFDPLTLADEEARLSIFRDDLDTEFATLVGSATSPALVEQVHTFLGAEISPGRRRPWQRVHVNVQDDLLMKSLDPGTARYLGLMTQFDSLPEQLDATGQPIFSALLVAGVFACKKFDPLPLPPDATEKRILERLIAQTPQLARATLRASKLGLTPRVFVAPALAAPLPDRPSPPNVLLGTAIWIRADEGPSTEFRQQFVVDSPPLAPVMSLGRLTAEGWQTRHELVGDPPRAATRMLGVSDSQSSLRGGRIGIVYDTPIEADGAPWTYRLSLSDMFGRFGDPTDLAVPLPARPPLPAPTLRPRVEPAARVAHQGPAPSGSLHLQLIVPESTRMTAGSLALALAIVEFDGGTQTQPTPLEGGTLTFDFTTPDLMPMEAQRLKVIARFEDVEGNIGPSASVDIDIADPRAPLIPETGIGIVWSSRPGPSEDVEFNLHFAGAPNARYRVYMSDARGLDIADFDRGRRRTRAEIAVEGAQLGLAGVALRDRFRLLTDKPLEPAGGRVLLQTHLPRALETVQFLRFVPISPRGNEADFAACPLLPIAVPSDRMPPAPHVAVDVDGDTGIAHITITAAGLDLVALKAAEPGLFNDPPDDAARAPSWRLRRASGGVPDAVYAREIGRGALAFDGENFVATIDDSPTPTGLLPYVKWFYWADVRMPAERRLPPDVIEVPLPAGSIEPTQPSQREDAPAVASLPSAPAMAMFVPSTMPTLTEDMCTATVALAAGGASWVLNLTVVGGPVVSVRAVGRYTLDIHVQKDDKNFEPQPAPFPFENGALTFVTGGAAQMPAVRIALVVTDPVGRIGKALLISAVPI